MSTNTVKARLRIAKKTESAWKSLDPVLLDGELAVSIDVDNAYKIGNGTSKWSSLNYAYQASFDALNNEFLSLNNGGHVQNSVEIDDLTTGNLIVTGSGRFTNGLYGDLIGNASSADKVDWSGVQNKPSSYTPSSHTHDDRYYTESEIDTKLSKKSDTGHTHDDRYYTESEINTKVNTLQSGIDGKLSLSGGTMQGNITGNLIGNVTGNVTGNAGTATKLKSPVTINGVSFDGSSNIIANAIPFIIGTHTATTASWTGEAPTISELYDGLSINYWIPFNSNGNTTLTLTLKNSVSTGAVPCYYGSTSRLTTHYSYGRTIHLTYRISPKFNNTTGTTGWYCDGDYDSDSNLYLRYYTNIKAVSAITSSRLICGNSSGYKLISSGATFDIGYPILFSGSSISANSSGNNNYLSYYNITISNIYTMTGTVDSVLYLKGTLSGNSFIVDTQILTCTIPTKEDGFAYMSLGIVGGTSRSTNYFSLQAEHKIFAYKNEKFREIVDCAQSVDWSGIQNKPTTYAPSSHTHDDRYYTETEIDTKLSTLQSSIDGKQASITGAASTITSSNLTANRVLISNSSGKVAVSTVTNTELGYLSGTTSSIQTQINSHTGNTSNPHSVTKDQVGLGNVENKTSATIRGEITSSNVTKALGYDPKTYTDGRFTDLIGTSPENLDTIYELASAVNSNKSVIDSINAAITKKSDIGHTHDDRYYTETEIDTKLSKKSDTGHTHDDRYYTESEINTKINTLQSNIDGKLSLSLGGHVANSVEIDDLTSGNLIVNGVGRFTNGLYGNLIGNASSADRVDWSGIQNKPGSYTPSSHTHDDRYYTESEVDTKLGGKSDTGHTHDDRYYTESEVNTKVSTLQSGIDGKLSLGGGTLTGDLNFSATQTICWNDGTYRQRIAIVDDSTANTDVFNFQQSTDAGKTFPTLMAIKDNGTVVATTFIGNFTGNLTGNATTSSSCSGNSASATKATQDSDGNAINSTYLKKSGGTLTGALTFANGTWNTVGDDVKIGDINIGGTLGIIGNNGNTAIRLVQYNTTPNTGTSTKGVSWVCTGDGVSSISGTLSGSFSGNLNGNATTATKLATAKTISLTGAVTGSVSFDGNDNVSIATSEGVTSFKQMSTQITATTDWDTVIDIGCYKVQMPTWGNADTYHSPNKYLSNLYNFGLLLVFKSNVANENRTVQIYLPHQADSGTGIILTRMLNGSSWNNWSPIFKGISKSYIGLGNVDNVADSSKNVLSATKWTTSRNFTIGDSTKSVDGSGNVSWSLSEIGTVSKTGGNATGTWGIGITGNASTATALTSSAGSALQPIYFSSGLPQACTYSLASSVPANAKFTDTNTWRGIQNNLTSDSTEQSLSASQGKLLNETKMPYETILIKKNLNDCKVNGFYYAQGGNAVTNKPSGVNAFGLNIIRSAGGWYTQILYASDNNMKTFRRWFDGTNWSNWVEEKITDTVYTHPTTSGNKHIPSGGSSGQILRWSSDGTAVWGADNNTTYTLSSFEITASATEINYTKGVTSAIQSQLNGKALKSHTHTSANITDATNANTANMIVKRDASGNFSAGTITATLSGTSTGANNWNIVHGNELCTSASTASGLWINYRNGYGGASSGNVSITKYYFANRNGSTSGVTIQAESFLGNASTATTATNLSGGTVSATTGTFSSTLSVTGTSTFTGKTVHNGSLDTEYINVNKSASGSGGGISLYGSSGSVTSYGIAMRTSSNGGSHGYNNGDWNIYNYMSGGSSSAKRGWIWRSAQGNVASISQYGDAQFDGKVKIGGSPGCELAYDSTMQCLNFIFS